MIDDLKIVDILLSGSYISEEDAKSIKEVAADLAVPISSFLINKSYVTKDLLGQAISEAYKLPYLDLNSKPPTKEQVLKTPEDFANEFRVVLFEEKENTLTFATDNAERKDLIENLKIKFPGKTIKLGYSLSEDIDISLVNYRKSLDTRFSKILETQKRIAPEIIDEILADSLTFRASDIHFEPQETEVIIRFRVDGVLHEAGRLPKIYYENILNRIKIQGHLRIDEHFAAQDGSMRVKIKGVNVDLRISIVPTLDGEKIVMRVLAEYVKGFGLPDLGLSEKHRDLLEKTSHKPFGMILVSGPTGSGKTTSLYAVLKILHKPEVNITTIEDPVEYKIPGINQIQINEETKLTFAQGLRSIVRQDPDIILVGEIRDPETAEISVNAALTGHLLLSTFHANDAATAVVRLVDMGIEPFLLSSTLELVIAQRLVRKICDSCKHSVSVKKTDLTKKNKNISKYFKTGTTTLYQGKGCNACGQTGYAGRTAIFEFIEVTPEMEDLILKNPSSGEVSDLAIKQGALSLFEDGLDKVFSGVTTLEELLRVAMPPEK